MEKVPILFDTISKILEMSIESNYSVILGVKVFLFYFQNILKL
jgi:hypothetical protein